MPSRTYLMPGSNDLDVTVDFSVTRAGGITIGDLWIDGQILSGDALFVKRYVNNPANRFLRDEKFITLEQHFMERLEDDSADIMQDEYDSYPEAAE